ncbi:MAG: cell division protein SepF [Clostridia bacterium]|nr:cell division protein SepF [Clostridia bacterium]
MYESIFENYDAFYNMVLSTTIMCNTPSETFYKDATKIIDFIGAAFGLDAKTVKICSKIILEDLAELGLTTDRLAVYSERRFGDNLTDIDVLGDIKCDVLAKLSEMHDKPDAGVNPGWFDYSHYKTYQAKVRFCKIESAGESGNIICARQAGILKLLGIGCSVNLDYAIKRFTQCSLWGDITSIRYLSYAYKLKKDDEKSKTYSEVVELCKKFLKSGTTVIPDNVKNDFSESAKTYFVYIASIVQDVVHAFDKKNIDYSFIEAITSEKLDYSDIMSYINNYKDLSWKNVTNAIERPRMSLGFITKQES